MRILPFIGEKELFRQFHLDEPWDSEHNKALIAKMPDIYLRPGRPNNGKTTFLVPVGKGLAFDGTEGLTIGSFDEVRMTIMMVNANDDRAVIWTKPDDLEVDTEKPKNGLGDASEGGFDVLFGDGHIDFLKKAIKATTLNSLFRVRRRTN